MIYYSLLFLPQICIDMHEIALKAMFSTTYIGNSKYQSRKIKNIDDLTNQVSHKGQKLILIAFAFSL